MRELTYTARITQALSNATLTNTVDLLYHSLTDTIPGVRPYTDTDRAVVETAPPSLHKATDPITLRVGDVTTYTLVFTVPAGTVGMGGDSYLEDTLPAGLWYITATETLTWTPSAVEPITFTDRTTGTLATRRRSAGPLAIPSPARRRNRRSSRSRSRPRPPARMSDGEVWPQDGEPSTITNTVALTQRGRLH